MSSRNLCIALFSSSLLILVLSDVLSSSLQRLLRLKRRLSSSLQRLLRLKRRAFSLQVFSDFYVLSGVIFSSLLHGSSSLLDRSCACCYLVSLLAIHSTTIGS